MSRIAFVGSSSVEPLSPLPAALAVELGLGERWVALGRRGSRISQWTEPELPPDVRAAVVMIVGNDARPTAAGVRAVDAAIRREAPAVVWLPPPPYPADSRIAGRDRRMREALAASGVVWVDREVVMSPSLFAPDRVHPTLAGYRAYAQQVAPMLFERLMEAMSSHRTPAQQPAAEAAPDVDPSVGVIGHVFTSGGLRLALTSADALWMARACTGEGGGEVDAASVTSTMVRRWAMLRDASASSPFRTLTDLVVGRFEGPRPYEGSGREVELRGYSQPVSVQFRGPGPRAERRRRFRTMAWRDTEPWRRTAVLEVLTGRRTLTAAPAVHFAARGLVERRLQERPGWRIVSVPGASNVFVSNARSRAYREPVVFGADGRRVAPRPSVSTSRPPSVASRGAESPGAGMPLLIAGLAGAGLLAFGRG